MILRTTWASEIAGDQAVPSRSTSMLPEVAFTKGDQMGVANCTFGGLRMHRSSFFPKPFLLKRQLNASNCKLEGQEGLTRPEGIVMRQQNLQFEDAIFVGRLARPCESCSPTIAEGLYVFVFHRGQVEVMTGQCDVPQLFALA